MLLEKAAPQSKIVCGKKVSPLTRIGFFNRSDRAVLQVMSYYCWSN